jgi:hypothetical protein
MASKEEHEQVGFGAALIDVAEGELGASVSDDEDDLFFNRLWQSYLDAGKPKRVKQWLREALKPFFKSLGKPPVWVEDTPTWPFSDGLPMTFVCQLELPAFELAGGQKMSPATLYVFVGAASDEDGHGWRAVFKCIEHHADDDDWEVVKVVRGPKEF